MLRIAWGEVGREAVWRLTTAFEPYGRIDHAGAEDGAGMERVPPQTRGRAVGLGAMMLNREAASTAARCSAPRTST